MGCFILFASAGPVLTAASGRVIYHDEPTVISVASAELHGEPLYHSPTAAARYSLLYGPLTYWLYMPPMLAHAMDLRIFQLWVLLPLTLSFYLAWRIARTVLSATDATFMLFCFAVAVITQSTSEWAMKGDVWILFALCLALWASLELGGVGAPLVVGLSGAMLINLKFTAAVPLLIPLLLVKERFGSWPAVRALTISAVFTVTVFAIPQVSLHNYWFWLHASMAHGLSAENMLENALFMAFLALPVSTLYAILHTLAPGEARSWFQNRRMLLVATTLAAVLAVVTGSKVGAGTWHCMPLAPIMMFLAADVLAGLRSVQPSWKVPVPAPLHRTAALLSTWLCVGLLLVAAKTSLWTLKLHLHGGDMASATAPASAASDLKAILQANPGRTIEMGYGDNTSYDLTFQRPLLVLSGNPYTLDADAMSEMDLSGLPLPQATLDAMRSCAVDIWLIPHNDIPFSMTSYYFRGGDTKQRDVFPHQLREAFLASYRRSSQSRFYDSWTCSHHAS